jgi:hypothetical protein
MNALLLRSTTVAALLLGGLIFGSAQSHQFTVMLNKDKLLPGDTLDIAAHYALQDRQLPPATFAVTIAGEGQQVWQMRYPMIDGKAAASIIWPAGIAPGRYNLLFAVQPRFLKAFGKVVFPEKPGRLLAHLSNSTDGIMQDIVPDRMGRFTLTETIFVDSVFVAFHHQNEREPAPPLVQLDAWLDSSFQPAATSVKQVVVNMPGQTDLAPLPLQKDAVFANGYAPFFSQYLIDQKIQKWQHLKGLELYDSLYLPPLFSAAPTKTIECLTADSVLAANSVYELLLLHLPNATLGRWIDENNLPSKAPAAFQLMASETMVKWNEKWYRIYCKGRYGDPSVLMLRPEALAAIKVFDPPFVSVPGVRQNFGTLAFFERRYPFPQPYPFYNGFWLKGYTPDMYTLPL